MNAVGTEWPHMCYQGYDECSGYGMGHAWVTEEMSEEKCTQYDTHVLLCLYVSHRWTSLILLVTVCE